MERELAKRAAAAAAAAPPDAAHRHENWLCRGIVVKVHEGKWSCTGNRARPLPVHRYP